MSKAKWKVRLSNIEWDDGKGDYDVSHLPRSLDVWVNASDADQALQYAMEEAGDSTGFLIQGVHTVVLFPPKRLHTVR